MKDVLKELRAVYINDGPDDTKIELTRHAESISKLAGPEWVAFKTELRKIISISETDLKEIRKTDKVSKVKNDWSVGLDVDDKGRVMSGVKNCSYMIDHHPNIEDGVKFNEFLQRPTFTKEMSFMPDIKLDDGGFVEFDDTKISQLRKWLSYEAGEFSKVDIIDSIVSTSMANRYNPLVSKLIEFNTEWDQKPRLDEWLFTYCKAETHEGMDEDLEKEYIRRVGSMWMISAVARAFDAGCKVDTMLILEGDQGDKKSSVLKELSLGYFLELITSFSRAKDVVDQMFGKWIVELPELRALDGDRDSNKAFLTRQFDKERLSYARFSKDFPRRCVFIGTTNDDRYLRDFTGNRRYWPVKVKSVDLEAIKADIPHLWGEAVQRYSAGEKWWFDNSDDNDKEVINTSMKIQGIKQEYDEQEDSLGKWLADNNLTTVKSSFVWSKFMDGHMNMFKKPEQMRVGNLLKGCGFKRVLKNKERVWVKDE